MRTKFSKVLRKLSLLLCLSLFVTAFIPGVTFASLNENSATFIPIDESNISRAEAEMLSLYVVESSDDINFSKARTVEITDSNRSYINSGEVFNPGFFTFTGTNTGRYRTLNGNKVKLSIVWTQTSTTAPCQLSFELQPTG